MSIKTFFFFSSSAIRRQDQQSNYSSISAQNKVAKYKINQICINGKVFLQRLLYIGS